MEIDLSLSKCRKNQPSALKHLSPVPARKYRLEVDDYDERWCYRLSSYPETREDLFSSDSSLKVASSSSYRRRRRQCRIRFLCVYYCS